QATKAATGPWAGDADPAGAVFIFLAVAVPMELHLDAAIFICPDFLSFRSHYTRGLRAVGTGDRRDAGCTVLNGCGQGDEGFFIEIFGPRASGIACYAHAVIDR